MLQERFENYIVILGTSDIFDLQAFRNTFLFTILDRGGAELSGIGCQVLARSLGPGRNPDHVVRIVVLKDRDYGVGILVIIDQE